MRLSWSWPSRAEDRFESWLAQSHEERVLAGETTPVGSCPDEAFLRETVPTGTNPPTSRRWTNHSGFGFAYRTLIR